MTDLEFKKLLIDLRTSRAEVAREVGLSGTGVKKYFRGNLRKPERRAQIKIALEKRAKARGLALPDFW